MYNKILKNILSLSILSLVAVSTTIHAQVAGTPYILPSSGILPGVTFCTGKTISVTGCASISGTSVNDDISTTQGTEYDWTGATGYIASNTTTRALIEIGGQCWYRINADRVPSNFPSPSYSSTSDVGWHGYYTGGPYTNEGRLYQWSAAMNGSTTERAQGICAPGFHIPSLCEYYQMASFLGASASCINNIHNNSSIWPPNTCVSFFSKTQLIGYLGFSPTNSTGFSLLPVGHRSSVNGFSDRNSFGGGQVSTSTLVNGRPMRIDNDSRYDGIWSYEYGAVEGETFRCVADEVQTFPKSCKEIKDANPAATDGVYNIDPDGTGPLLPMQAQCDMTTDGGGWTMITNYVRSGTNVLGVGKSFFPLLASSTIGANESSNTLSYAHINNSLFNAIATSATTVRGFFQNTTSTVHYKSDFAMTRLKAGSSASATVTDMTALPGNTATLTGWCLYVANINPADLAASSLIESNGSCTGGCGNSNARENRIAIGCGNVFKVNGYSYSGCGACPSIVNDASTIHRIWVK